jgi:hypothetical protein
MLSRTQHIMREVYIYKFPYSVVVIELPRRLEGVAIMSQVYMRVSETHEHYVVAMCDKQLLGKTLTEGNIKFKISEEFYGGELVDVKTCLSHLARATIANMVGKKSVQTAVNAGLVHEQAIILIEGHPHAQWVKL